MKIPVDIRIRSERICTNITRGDGTAGTVRDDYSTSGFMSRTKDGYRMEFRERGADKFKTVLSTFGDSVSVNRESFLGSSLVFTESRANTCICNAGEIPVAMRINTKKLVNTLSMEGGSLSIDYTVEIVGNLAEKSHVTYSVSPDKSIIRS